MSEIRASDGSSDGSFNGEGAMTEMVDLDTYEIAYDLR
jgi:hypothetical protein